jgi:hypothetical protein
VEGTLIRTKLLLGTDRGKTVTRPRDRLSQFPNGFLWKHPKRSEMRCCGEEAGLSIYMG